MQSSLRLAVATVGCALALSIGACTGAVTPITPSQSAPSLPTAPDGVLHLNTAHDYGDLYSDGIVPIGDERWSLTTPAVGIIYLCNDNFVADEQAGAQNRGPWFVSASQWDENDKLSIQGEIDWESQFSVEISGDERLIVTNDLPVHHTGVFPVSNSDPARVYDANPNTISEQNLNYALAATPTVGEPSCMGGEAGVMLTGVSLFNGFDAGGRDAGAWEVQDSCGGHPQGSGQYHYHSLSRCINEIGVDTVIGWALDGFPITGPVVGNSNILTTSDLDVCHGLVSEIEVDGVLVESYHYVMTQDFPYSVSCFRGTASATPRPAGDGQQPGPPPPPPGPGAP